MQASSRQEGTNSHAAEEDFHGLTVERLCALLKERGLSPKGKKNELIARVNGANSQVLLSGWKGSQHVLHSGYGRILHKTTDFKKGYAIQVGSLYIYHSQLKSLLCPSISCNGMVPCKLAEAHGNEIPWHKSDEQPSVPVKTKIVITSLSRQPNKQKIAQRKRKMGEKEEEY